MPHKYLNIARENYYNVKKAGSGNTFNLGVNLYANDDAFLADRTAVRAGDTLMTINYNLIRNAQDVSYVIRNAETGEVYFSKDYGKQSGAFYYTNGGSWAYTSTTKGISWRFTDNEGNALPNNTKLELVLTAVPEYYTADENGNYTGLGKGAAWKTLVTVDNEAPAVTQMFFSSDPAGRKLINIDSEVEGIFTVSCAGGARADCCLPIRRQQFNAPVQEIAVTGLVGGHSGAEIDKGRANSSMLLGRVLCALEQKTPLRVISVSGGLKDNAIPTASVALVAADAGAVQAVCAEMDAAFKKEYRVNDPAITVSARPAESSLLPMDEASSRSAVCLLACLPNGIQAMSADMPGLVQTSLNLGILTTGDDAVHASFSVRSLSLIHI